MQYMDVDCMLGLEVVVITAGIEAKGLCKCFPLLDPIIDHMVEGGIA